MTWIVPSPREPDAVRTFDTNVVVRVLVEDDVEQCRLAEAAWREELARGGIFLPLTVLVEVGWVLRTAYRFDRSSCVQALRRLTLLGGVTVERAEIVGRALEAFERGPGDFADCVVLESARAEGALPVVTFDRSFARSPEVALLGAR